MSQNLWLKAHVMIGTRTNIVTAVEVTPSNVNDSPVLPDLLDASSRRFTMQRVSADKGYLSDENVATIAAYGAQPFIPPKVNSRFGVVPDASRRRSDTWHKMFHYYQFRRDEFLHHYHRRSNVETTFHMIKAKFGSRLRSKTRVALENEVLAKVLCHNLCVLVQSIYELGIAATFWGLKR